MSGPNLRRGEVWIVNFNPAGGSEQKGNRPAVVVQNDTGNLYASTTVVAAQQRSKNYQNFMHSEIEEEIEDFYKGPYQKPVLGSKAFIEKVRAKLGDKAVVKRSRNRGKSLG